MEIREIVRVLDDHIAKLTQARDNIVALDGSPSSSPRSYTRKGVRRILSASARRRIAVAQRARWAKWKRDKGR